VLSRVPWPLEKGDKLRAFNQLKQLSKKHEVILFALNDTPLCPEALSTLKNYCSDIKVVRLSKARILTNIARSFFSSLPLQVGYFYFPDAQNEFDAFVEKHKPDHIYCQLIRTAEYVKKHTSIPKTLDYMDVFSKGMERRNSTAPFYLRPLFGMEHKRLLSYEAEVFDRFNNTIIISEQDRSLMPVRDKEKISVIANGVDTDFFRPMESKKEFELLFNGNMNYPPNVESVEYLVNKVMPIVLKKYPALRLLISGATPSPKVLALRSRHVFITGWVEDVRENFAKSKILVAPMQISIGLQNKLLEAMAMKIPCVTSPMSCNAMNAENGKHLLVAKHPEEYAEHIFSLLENEELSNRITENAYKFVINNYNWESTTAQLEKLMEGVSNLKLQV
jgi:sugar transferase (PEP-CTERM/EpsH1 system associated)